MNTSASAELARLVTNNIVTNEELMVLGFHPHTTDRALAYRAKAIYLLLTDDILELLDVEANNSLSEEFRKFLGPILAIIGHLEKLPSFRELHEEVQERLTYQGRLIVVLMNMDFRDTIKRIGEKV